MTRPTKGPWHFSGQLIAGAPEPFPNPKAEPVGKTIASLAWDYDGDYGAPEYRIKWPEARANGMVMIRSERLYSSLKTIVEIARVAMNDMPPTGNPEDRAAAEWFAEADKLIAEIEGE